MVVRMGFGVDVVAYSGRGVDAKHDAQRRIVALVDAVLAAIGVTADDPPPQYAGDSALVFLPASVDLPRALFTLLRTATEWLGEDNERNRDRLRVRISAVVGPVAVAPAGILGNAPVECARLRDSDALRGRLAEHADLDLAVLVSQRLYSDVVAEGYADLPAGEFERVDVQVKDFHSHAWLWLPEARVSPVPRPTPVRTRTVRSGVPRRWYLPAALFAVAAVLVAAVLVATVSALGNPAAPAPTATPPPASTPSPVRRLSAWASEVEAICRPMVPALNDDVKAMQAIDPDKIQANDKETIAAMVAALSRLDDQYSALARQIHDVAPPSYSTDAVQDYIRLFDARGEKISAAIENLQSNTLFNRVQAAYALYTYGTETDQILAKAKQLGVESCP
jgi:hypothetical protein